MPMVVKLTRLPWPFDSQCTLTVDNDGGIHSERNDDCEELQPVYERLKAQADAQNGPPVASGIPLIDWFQGLIGGGGSSSSSTSSAIPASVPRAPVSSLTSGTIAGIPKIAFIAAGIGAAAFFATRGKKKRK